LQRGSRELLLAKYLLQKEKRKYVELRDEVKGWGMKEKSQGGTFNSTTIWTYHKRKVGKDSTLEGLKSFSEDQTP